VPQNICEINKQLKLVFEILNEIIVMNGCLNKVNVWDGTKVCKIVINKVNKIKSKKVYLIAFGLNIGLKLNISLN
jgi:hypothetical protein